MAPTSASAGRKPRTPRDRNHPGCNAGAHLRWLLDQPPFIMALGGVRGAGAEERRGCSSWRDFSVILRGTGVDADRFERWRGTQRRLGWLLPPHLRPLIHVLARDPAAPVNVPPSRSLPPEKTAELREICLQSLDADAQPLNGRQRQQLKRYLAAIDPVSEPTVQLSNPAGLRVGIGDPVTICATSAGVASWIAQPARDGFPILGPVATTVARGGDISVAPDRIPRARRNRTGD